MFWLFVLVVMIEVDVVLILLAWFLAFCIFFMVVEIVGYFMIDLTVVDLTVVGV